jgi:hypothetical protein
MTTDYEIRQLIIKLGKALANKNADEIQEWMDLLTDEIGRWSNTGQWSKEIQIVKPESD